jgi:hypothetical protein
MPVCHVDVQAFSFKTFNMVKFKASELSEKNYKEGDTVFLAFDIKSLKMSTDDELWLHSSDNNNNVWLKQDAVVYGEPYKYRDGDIVNYNGKPGKIVSGFNDDWYVLTSDGTMFDLNPALINTVIKENNVL